MVALAIALRSRVVALGVLFLAISAFGPAVARTAGLGGTTIGAIGFLPMFGNGGARGLPRGSATAPATRAQRLGWLLRPGALRRRSHDRLPTPVGFLADAERATLSQLGPSRSPHRLTPISRPRV